jgi:hypothetical protein
MLTVVKLKTPSAGIVSVVLVVGLNAPSAPVLPLSGVALQPETPNNPSTILIINETFEQIRVDRISDSLVKLPTSG